MKADIAWCNARHIEYVPCIYPGFSWYNLGKAEVGGILPSTRSQVTERAFLLEPIQHRVQRRRKIYVMFDCVTKVPIFVSPTVCRRALCISYQGVPSDHTIGRAGRKLLRRDPTVRISATADVKWIKMRNPAMNVPVQ